MQKRELIFALVAGVLLSMGGCSGGLPTLKQAKPVEQVVMTYKHPVHYEGKAVSTHYFGEANQ